jgi:hypothetical protein
MRPLAITFAAALSCLVVPFLVGCGSSDTSPSASATSAVSSSSDGLRWVELEVTVAGEPATMLVNANDYFDDLQASEDLSSGDTTFAARTGPSLNGGGGVHILTPRGNLDNPCSREAKAACSRGGKLDLACACDWVANNCAGQERKVAEKFLGCRRSRATHEITVELPAERATAGNDVVWEGLRWAIVGVGACFASGVCEVVLAPVGL